MPIIYHGQANDYYNAPTTFNGTPKFGFGFEKKKGYRSFYYGGAWRDFGNNVVIGQGNETNEEKKKKVTAQIKQQNAVDRIIKNTRTKEDIISGGAFKTC